MGNNHKPEIRFPGYIGDWEQRKLGELIEISSAARVHKNEWTTSGVRFFRSSDVVSNFNGKKNTPAFISYSLYDELSKKSGLVQPGDILITGGGSIGIPYLVADREPLYFKDADLIWLKSANKIYGYFLYFYFVTPQLRKYISSITHIGTISHYTIEQAKDTPISLPEQVEQTLIGNFLKKLDEMIALHQQELTTLKQTKQGFLQKMFPKEGESVPEVRFLGFTGDWKEKKLNEVAKYRNGKAHEKNISYNGKYIVINSKFVSTNGKVKKFSDEQIAPMYKNEIAFVLSDVPNGRAIARTFLVKTNDTYSLNQRIAGITPGRNTDAYFLYTLMNRHHYFLRFDDGVGQTNLSKEDIERFIENYPSLEEQQKIGTFFKQLDDTIALHQHELDALKETKKAFLQKMFV
ncbi:restriction endonuclease subunit S [Brevibacillus laterosporus]|uniref:restriction endonuclease subunit S n=1 Tax=Brevibacillus laterosporus TaxID=1465 RepID=UPI002E2072C2|nr:restriction endonuclease subunit S [Brevibacillus laterosporus]MED1788573.1 restriction endonuclease subunit S [Brevibacillus laterosporus]